MTVGQICKTQVITVAPNCSVLQAAELMAKHHIGDLVVVEGSNGDRKPVGIVTDRDLVVKVMATRQDTSISTVEQVMSADVLCAPQNQGLEDTLEEMRLKGVNRVPVVTTSGNLYGVLTANDIFETLLVQLNGLASTREGQKVREECTLS